MRTTASELPMKKHHLALILKAFLSDPPKWAYFVVTGYLSVEVGQMVFPKLHVFLLLLFFTARLSCSRRLTGSHQSAPP